MPKRCKHGEETTNGSGEDRISALPDAILHVVLSSLPSDETVRTCVLSRRWRHLWKSTPALRITRGGGWRFMEWRAWTVNNFVNQLLLLRDRVPLDECEISISQEFLNEDEDELFRFVHTWIRHAVSLCKARVLKVRIRTESYRLPLVNLPFSSQFLTRVELTDVILRSRSLDFSNCPALEDLRMRSCRIYAHRIISQSLRCLSITRCDFRTPLLESMPSLVTAFVRLDYSCSDTCIHKAYGDCGDDICFGQSDGSAGRNRSVLLQGLSGATNLQLTCDPEVFIFRKDSKKCPTFTMLKTLVLNDWCVAADLRVLVRLLQHTPVLENLTLQLQPREESVVETDESYNLAEQLLLLKHLKVVEIKCYKEDEVVHKIVSILSTFGVHPEQIDIEQNFFQAPESCSFEFSD
ncbi:MEIOTIC F-BOX protein MOF isoform X2 [Lolium perenne]|uniref:MEIOTIC F-BOX protein MOF isoform X2 n=1 Tax=Lolium perenne TaxID=4522 RepID=UPI0021F54F49|nr:putative F-box/LRR-repeat protein At3g28410 isoform X2 [Lolium perenne]